MPYKTRTDAYDIQCCDCGNWMDVPGNLLNRVKRCYLCQRIYRRELQAKNRKNNYIPKGDKKFSKKPHNPWVIVTDTEPDAPISTGTMLAENELYYLLLYNSLTIGTKLKRLHTGEEVEVIKNINGWKTNMLAGTDGQLFIAHKSKLRLEKRNRDDKK